MMVKYTFMLAAILACGIAEAAVTVPMYQVTAQGPGASLGSVTLADSPYGLIVTPNLHGLTPGAHGFHIHQNPSCADAAMAAGGHLDPIGSDLHLGPYNNTGHLGDLPVLVADANGDATLPVLAPKLTLAQADDHALMIHAGGDNYADIPEKLGGGGARFACGVIPK